MTAAQVKFWNRARSASYEYWQRDPCVWCGELPRYSKKRKRWTRSIDHIVPRCHGGSDNWDNKAPACKACNQARANIPLLWWLMVRRMRKKDIRRYWARQLGERRLRATKVSAAAPSETVGKESSVRDFGARHDY